MIPARIMRVVISDPCAPVSLIFSILCYTVLYIQMCGLSFLVLQVIYAHLVTQKKQKNLLASLSAVLHHNRSTFTWFDEIDHNDSRLFLGPSVQPDLTKSIPLRHQRAYSASRGESVGTPSEKAPMINTNTRPLPQREYYMQISPNANCDHHDYMQIGKPRRSEAGCTLCLHVVHLFQI